MSSYFEIPVIIPAYEPDEKLIVLLQRLKEAGIVNIVVVDDGSGNDYRKLFEQAACMSGCNVLTHMVNLGKGRALKTAFNYCLKQFPAKVRVGQHLTFLVAGQIQKDAVVAFPQFVVAVEVCVGIAARVCGDQTQV